MPQGGPGAQREREGSGSRGGRKRAAQGAGGLPEPWRAYTSSQGAVFYYNTATHERTGAEHKRAQQQQQRQSSERGERAQSASARAKQQSQMAPVQPPEPAREALRRTYDGQQADEAGQQQQRALVKDEASDQQAEAPYDKEAEQRALMELVQAGPEASVRSVLLEARLDPRVIGEDECRALSELAVFAQAQERNCSGLQPMCRADLNTCLEKDDGVKGCNCINASLACVGNCSESATSELVSLCSNRSTCNAWQYRSTGAITCEPISRCQKVRRLCAYNFQCPPMLQECIPTFLRCLVHNNCTELVEPQCEVLRTKGYKCSMPKSQQQCRTEYTACSEQHCECLFQYRLCLDDALEQPCANNGTCPSLCTTSQYVGSAASVVVTLGAVLVLLARLF
eukprot:m51a1_g4286 hypothetical protein (397) ;mRNA; f:379560-383114